MYNLQCKNEIKSKFTKFYFIKKKYNLKHVMMCIIGFYINI